jgi:hypothetical protein
MFVARLLGVVGVLWEFCKGVGQGRVLYGGHVRMTRVAKSICFGHERKMVENRFHQPGLYSS